MAATAQSAIAIGSVGFDIQAVKAFGEHHRIMVEHTTFNAGDSGSRNFVYM